MGAINATLVAGNGFIFELDADFLLNYEKKNVLFKSLPKYQQVTLDVSMLVPLATEVKELEAALLSSESRVRELFLLDYFEKQEWKDHRSVTIRSIVRDDNKTLSKDDIEKIQTKLHNSVKRLGVKLR